jgi:hypothetical protein
MGYKYIEIGFIILYVWILVHLTLPFEEKYEHTLKEMAKEPLFRTILGIGVIWTSLYSVPVAGVFFLIVFFLIADVHLISTTKM